MLLALSVSCLTALAGPSGPHRIEDPSAVADPVDLVRAHPVSAGFEQLTATRVRAGYGHTVRVYGHQTGLRTQQPLAVIRVDPQGQPRLLTTFDHGPPRPRGPLLSPDVLVERIADPLHASQVGPARWWPVGGRLVAARSVWSDHPSNGLLHPVLLVDATTGQVLDRTDDTVHATKEDRPQSAYIYPVDPVVTPDLETVDLPPGTRRGLRSSHFTMYNCLDRGNTYGTNSDLGEVDLRHCQWVRPAPVEDAMWLFEPEPYPGDPAQDEDAFAAPHVLWHGEETIRDLIEMGLPLADRPENWQHLASQTNRRTTDLLNEDTMSDPDAPLMPYDNAFFRRGRELSDGSYTLPETVFGQGTIGDFAYDADVIIHELGHFAVWTQNGPSGSRNSAHGSTAEPGALNEGLADYFAAVRTGDPEIGTYSGESLGRPYIRTLDGSARCPESIYGQVHADSQPFAQALWLVRGLLDAEDQPLFDRSVVDALPSMGPESSFLDATRAIEAEVALQLGSATADLVADAFAARDVHACAPWIPVENGAEARSFSQIPPFYADLYEQPIPGYVQFVIPDDGPLAVTIEFIQEKSLEVDLWGTNDPADVLLLHRAGAPITHTPYYDDDAALFVWAHDGEEVGAATRMEALDTALDGRTETWLYGTTVRLDGPGPHHLQLANLAERTVTAYGLVLSWEPAPTTEDTGDGITDRESMGKKAAGCACSQSPTPFQLAQLIPMLLLVQARRSRRT